MSLRITSMQVSQAINRALTARPAAPVPTQVSAVKGVSRGNAVSAPSQVPAKKPQRKQKDALKSAFHCWVWEPRWMSWPDPRTKALPQQPQNRNRRLIRLRQHRFACHLQNLSLGQIGRGLGVVGVDNFAA